MSDFNIIAELREATESYLNRHPNLSIQSVSHRAGVSYSTIRRVLQNEVKEIRDETILALIKVVLTQKKRVLFLQRHFPSLGELFSCIDQKDEPTDEEKLRYYRYKDPHNYILKLSLTSAGTTRQLIDDYLGIRGIEALEEMLEDQFLHEDRKGNIYHPCESNMILNADDILHQIIKDAKYFDRSSLGTNRSRMGHLSANLNPKAYYTLVGKVTNFLREIEAFKENPKNVGNVPVFVDILVNTYNRRELGENL